MSYIPVSILEVRMWEHRVGALMADPASGYFAFEYDPSFLKTGLQPSPLLFPAQQGARVFPSLPTETYKRLPAFIADALPDKFGNSLIDAWMSKQGLSNREFTVLDRLAYMGSRAMGALEFAPAIKRERELSEAIEVKQVVEAARRALTLNVSDLAADDDTAMLQLMQIGTSAGGAKAKAVIGLNRADGKVISGQFGLPEGYEPWLLKIDTGSKPYGCIEYAYYLMAIDCGVEMSDCTLFEAAGKQHFMTRRFDRDEAGGKLHMQTLCALAGMDFNQLGTHDYVQLFETSRGLGLGRDAVDQVYQRMLFNVCMANNDDHPKNHSFLMDRDGTWRLAPAYDMMYACNPANRWTARHAMGVSGCFEEISGEDCLAIGKRFNVSSAKERLDKTVEVALRWKEYAEQAGVDESTADEIGATIRRCAGALAAGAR